ncbi:MAG: PD-(D/E)XK nuclease family protein [SAR324 cluster bacterium]|nr:PD-(D/E)XK nuclease family protein [SAR324 cluster bacterium]
MIGFKNEFSWSKSREEIFRKCQKQYYYHYYGSWGGWQRNCDERTRTTYVLKKLVNRHLWSGEKVRTAIRRILEAVRDEKPIKTEEEVIEQTLRSMRDDFKSSRDQLYLESPKSCGLFEHEYQLELPGEVWKETAEHIEKCIRNFYHSPLLEEIKTIPKEQWLCLEELSYFLLNEVKVYVSIDLAIRMVGQVLVYDWKTGSSVEYNHDLQMACYGWFAWQQWEVDPKTIKLMEVNLMHMDTTHHQLTGVNLEKIQKTIFESIQDMQFLLEDIGNNQANEERFTMTENDRFCMYCNFKKICPKWEGSAEK